MILEFDIFWIGILLLIISFFSFLWIMKTISSCYSDELEGVLTITTIIFLISGIIGSIIVGLECLQFYGIII
jgi:hypothetical protein